MIKTEIVWTERYMTLAGSNAITVKNWAIMPTTARNFQKTSFGLGDLFIGD